MFSIYLPEGEPWYSTKRRVLDFDKGIALEYVRSLGKEEEERGKAFVLSDGTTRIPFVTRIIFDVNPKTGETYFYSMIDSFNHKFANAQDETRWRRTAAEALLIFGSIYNGFKHDPDSVRVELDGKLLTRRDFGYTK